ncbi:TRAPP trafficking subunit Trs65-domain-containing protein [Peziza echinospora]|nr:TRAPP trafficking subunit Trs65-domain-containing protein [Peziza echinospora]
MPESSGPEASTRNHTEILESSRLEILVPHASETASSDIIKQRQAENEAEVSPDIESLAGVPQRRSLFYDEKVPVFVGLELDPRIELSDRQFESFIEKIAIFLEVVAVEGSKATDQSSRPSDSLHVLHGVNLNDENSTRDVFKHNGRRLILWKVTVPLGHPRIRLISPKVLFAAVATIKSSGPGALVSAGQEYLTSRNIFGANLLESYVDGSSFTGPRPQLSALRVSRVSPVAQTPQHTPGSISYRSKRMFHLFPAINVRLRHSQVSASSKPEVIASLDIEISAGDVIINSVGLTMEGGQAELIGGPINELLPLSCRPRDEVTFLYSLKQTDPTSYSIVAAGPRPITLSLDATALVSDDCKPVIQSIWNTAIDLSNLLNTRLQPLNRMSRAMSIPNAYGTALTTSPGIRPTGPDKSPPLQFAIPAFSPEVSGLAITFSGPARVYVGEVFAWTVFVVNRSPRPRKLALTVPHKRWKADTGKALPPTAHDNTGHVLDESAVYTAHRSQILEPAELICLMNDVRIGYVCM